MICTRVALFAACLAAGLEPPSIDLTAGWRFMPDPGRAGQEAGWYTPAWSDAAWAVINAGQSWESQGFQGVDGYAWYRRTVEIPAAWEGRRVWWVVGGVNDACVVYCNGSRVNAYGDNREISCADTPIIVDLTPHIRFGETNVIAAEVYDWGVNGGLWRGPCALTVLPEELPLEGYLSCAPDFGRGELFVEVNQLLLGMDRSRQQLTTTHYRNGVQIGFSELNSAEMFSWDAEPALVQIGNMRAGDAVRVEILASAWDKEGRLIAEIPGVVAYTWPQENVSSSVGDKVKVLNNFVTELLVDVVGDEGSADYSFENPRDGWVFMSITGAAAPPQATLDNESAPLLWRTNPDTRAQEAMRFLASGAHQLRIEQATGARLIVRAIPEILFCYYPSTRHIQAYPEYDWAYMERHVLPHVNVLIARSEIAPHEFDQWLREGRRWLGNASLPGLGAAEPPAADAVHEAWAANPAVTQPGFSGMMVDEFLYAGAPYYEAWSTALTRLHEEPAFAGKTFYAWCGSIFRDAVGLEFCRLSTSLDDKFSWEKYLPEATSERRARLHISREIGRELAMWRDRQPELNRHLVLCLGYLSAPPETLNTNPGVDYHVFLDMQFHALATDPALQGLYGIMEYMAAYSDEESLRFAHKLFRHYCIDGARTRYSDDPYMLPHLQNGDFESRLDPWEVVAAEDMSVCLGSLDGFSWLEGRYPKTRQGDTFCRMTGSAKGPNVVRQTLRALEPGRLYSVKLISADLDRLDEQQTVGLAVTVEGGEPAVAYGFHYPYPSCYSHEMGPYNGSHPAWFTFHRFVFRAQAETATLRISDEPVSRAGRNIACNFVEVQPFWEP